MPRRGSLAVSDSFLISRGGAWSSVVALGAVVPLLLLSVVVSAIVVVFSVVVVTASAIELDGLWRLAGGEVGGDVADGTVLMAR